jgi:hypothetical protein
MYLERSVQSGFQSYLSVLKKRTIMKLLMTMMMDMKFNSV